MLDKLVEQIERSWQNIFILMNIDQPTDSKKKKKKKPTEGTGDNGNGNNA